MKPLILDYAVDRKQEGDVIFSYDKTLNLNVVKTDQKASPYVEIGDNMELLVCQQLIGQKR